MPESCSTYLEVGSEGVGAIPFLVLQQAEGGVVHRDGADAADVAGNSEEHISAFFRPQSRRNSDRSARAAHRLEH